MKGILLLGFHFLYTVLTSAVENYGLGDYGSIANSLKGLEENTFEKHGVSKVSHFSKEDDDEDFDLSDIMHLSRSSVGEDDDAFSSWEMMEIVDHHNIYRSNLTIPIPKGSNMQYVEWNETIASAAEGWLNKCKYQKGFDKHNNVTFSQGQNMYKGSSSLPSRVLYLWYREYKYFSFKNFSCKSPIAKYHCNHMTQMLWSDSSKIGCARKSNCFPLEQNSKMMNCHYYRAGNSWAIGTQMYKYGWPCTRCELSDGNLCFNSLCVDKRICNAYKLDCECKLNCKNCAKPNPEKCRCENCKSGWDWEDCSFPCVNAYDMHEGKPGFCKWKVESVSKKLCNHPEVSNMCRKTCGLCRDPNFKNATSLCCGGKICPPYHVLDEKCNCQKDCPSNLCLYPPSTTRYPLVLPLPTIVLNISIDNSTIFSNETITSIDNSTIFSNETNTSIDNSTIFSNETNVPRYKSSIAHHTQEAYLALILLVVSVVLLRL